MLAAITEHNRRPRARERRPQMATSSPYAFGHSPAETERLQRQGTLFNPSTRHFLASAGIGAGMKVLDVGSGAGDVALLVADLVGAHGAVVGVERDPGILRTAGDRARAAGLAHVSFVVGDVGAVG